MAGGGPWFILGQPRRRRRAQPEEHDMSDDEDTMDARRKQKANEIISRLAAEGKTRDIPAQKKANKELLGHEGEATAEDL
jgi:hypothetical protein